MIIRHLISEKESLIESLKNEKKQSYWGIIDIISVVTSISVFGFYQYKLKKRYRLRFEKIMNQNQEEKNAFMLIPKK